MSKMFYNAPISIFNSKISWGRYLWIPIKKGEKGRRGKDGERKRKGGCVVAVSGDGHLTQTEK